MSDVLQKIEMLDERELRGWWAAIMVDRVREKKPGEMAALMKRAKALGVDLQKDNWRSVGEIAAFMVGKMHG